MPTRRLPSRPSLDQLKRQAKELVAEQRRGTLQVCQRIREFHPRYAAASDESIKAAKFALSDGQLTIAREYGFASWARLHTFVRDEHARDLEKLHHERITDRRFRQAVDLLDEGDVEGLRQLLTAAPSLATQRVRFEGGNYFRDPSLLEFVAENPVRHDGLPPNIVEVARTILEAGARSDRRSVQSTLDLVSSGRVAREAGVQTALINLLCDYGADASAAIGATLVHGEFEAVNALIERGADVDLRVAAATGRIEEARRFAASASAEDRHLAFALAAQFGHAAIVKLLLDMGEDPNRFNPQGAHSHSTPMHQAALAGYGDTVRLLAEHGARVEIKDILWDGTPADWADHGGHPEIAAYLRGANHHPPRGGDLLKDRQPTSHERMAGQPWDASYHGGPAPWDIGHPQQAIVRLASGVKFAGPVLDAGCGTGENALHVASSLNVSVLGVDVAETALALARQKARDRGIAVDFAAADAFQLERLGRTFNTVLDSGLFHTFDADERLQYAASLASVAERDAMLYVLCFSDEGPDTGPHPISQADLRAAFNARTGWTVVAIEPERVETRFHQDGAPAWLATVKRIQSISS